jgi:lipopolysaccharide export system protein LptA
LGNEITVSNFDKTETQTGQKAIIFKITGNPVTIKAKKQSIEMTAYQMTAHVNIEKPGQERLQTVIASKGITGTYYQSEEKRTFRVRAETANYDSTKQTLTVKGNVTAIAEDELYRATQKGDQVTIYLGENPVRTVVDGDPRRTHAELAPKQPGNAEIPDKITMTNWSHYVIQQAKNDVTWKLDGQPVLIQRLDTMSEFRAAHINAQVEVIEEGQTGNKIAKVKSAKATGRIHVVYKQPEKKSVTQLRADTADYNGDQQVLVVKGNVTSEAETENYKLIQKGGTQATVYLAEDPVRVVLEADPTKSEATYIPKKQEEKDGKEGKEGRDL